MDDDRDAKLAEVPQADADDAHPAPTRRRASCVPVGLLDPQVMNLNEQLLRSEMQSTRLEEERAEIGRRQKRIRALSFAVMAAQGEEAQARGEPPETWKEALARADGDIAGAIQLLVSHGVPPTVEQMAAVSAELHEVTAERDTVAKLLHRRDDELALVLRREETQVRKLRVLVDKLNQKAKRLELRASELSEELFKERSVSSRRKEALVLDLRMERTRAVQDAQEVVDRRSRQGKEKGSEQRATDVNPVMCAHCYEMLLPVGSAAQSPSGRRGVGALDSTVLSQGSSSKASTGGSPPLSGAPAPAAPGFFSSMNVSSAIGREPDRMLADMHRDRCDALSLLLATERAEKVVLVERCAMYERRVVELGGQIRGLRNTVEEQQQGPLAQRGMQSGTAWKVLGGVMRLREATAALRSSVETWMNERIRPFFGGMGDSLKRLQAALQVAPRHRRKVEDPRLPPRQPTRQNSGTAPPLTAQSSTSHLEPKPVCEEDRVSHASSDVQDEMDAAEAAVDGLLRKVGAGEDTADAQLSQKVAVLCGRVDSVLKEADDTASLCMQLSKFLPVEATEEIGKVRELRQKLSGRGSPAVATKPLSAALLARMRMRHAPAADDDASAALSETLSELARMRASAVPSATHLGAPRRQPGGSAGPGAPLADVPFSRSNPGSAAALMMGNGSGAAKFVGTVFTAMQAMQPGTSLAPPPESRNGADASPPARAASPVPTDLSAKRRVEAQPASSAGTPSAASQRSAQPGGPPSSVGSPLMELLRSPQAAAAPQGGTVARQLASQSSAAVHPAAPSAPQRPAPAGAASNGTIRAAAALLQSTGRTPTVTAASAQALAAGTQQPARAMPVSPLLRAAATADTAPAASPQPDPAARPAAIAVGDLPERPTHPTAAASPASPACPAPTSPPHVSADMDSELSAAQTREQVERSHRKAAWERQEGKKKNSQQRRKEEKEQRAVTLFEDMRKTTADSVVEHHDAESRKRWGKRKEALQALDSVRWNATVEQGPIFAMADQQVGPQLSPTSPVPSSQSLRKVPRDWADRLAALQRPDGTRTSPRHAGTARIPLDTSPRHAGTARSPLDTRADTWQPDSSLADADAGCMDLPETAVGTDATTRALLGGRAPLLPKPDRPAELPPVPDLAGLTRFAEAVRRRRRALRKSLADRPPQSTEASLDPPPLPAIPVAGCPRTGEPGTRQDSARPQTLEVPTELTEELHVSVGARTRVRGRTAGVLPPHPPSIGMPMSKRRVGAARTAPAVHSAAPHWAASATMPARVRIPSKRI